MHYECTVLKLSADEFSVVKCSEVLYNTVKCSAVQVSVRAVIKEPEQETICSGSKL